MSREAEDASSQARDEVRIEGRRAVVTGAGGFIGTATCKRLAAEGAEVVGLDRDPALEPAVREAGAEFALVDVTERAALDRAMDGVELVVHTAAYVREWGEMEEFVRVNVGGTVNVLDAAADAGAERVLHISSVVVYGYDDEREQDEGAYRRNCGIPYIDTKSSSDRIACRRGAVVIRPGDVYGPGSKPWTIRQVEVAKSGQAAVPSPGDGLMLPLYVDDLTEAIVLGLRRGQPGRAYTVWDGKPVEFAELMERYARMTGVRGPRRLPRPLLAAVAGTAEAVARLRRQPPAFGRHGITLVDRRGTASNRRAREELGWKPRVDFDEGMRRSERWLRERQLI